MHYKKENFINYHRGVFKLICNGQNLWEVDEHISRYKKTPLSTSPAIMDILMANQYFLYLYTHLIFDSDHSIYRIFPTLALFTGIEVELWETNKIYNIKGIIDWH